MPILVTLESYRKLGEARGVEYTLDHIPRLAATPVSGWRCSQGHIFKRSYTQMRTKSKCYFCSRIRKKTVEDYQAVGAEFGITFTLSVLPKNTCFPTPGWLCSKGHTFSDRYTNIQQGWGCLICAKRFRKSLADYQQLAIQAGWSYTLDTIPANTSCLAVNAWKCSEGHILSTRYNTIEQNIHVCTVCIPQRLHRSEHLSRTILERLTGYQWPRRRPSFLDRNEFDGYCEELHAAHNYHGGQHYQWIPFFHKDEEDFENQVLRDAKTHRLAEENGVKYFVTSYHFDFRDPVAMEAHIRARLVELNIPLVTCQAEEKKNTTRSSMTHPSSSSSRSTPASERRPPTAGPWRWVSETLQRAPRSTPCRP